MYISRILPHQYCSNFIVRWKSLVKCLWCLLGSRNQFQVKVKNYIKNLLKVLLPLYENNMFTITNIGKTRNVWTEFINSIEGMNMFYASGYKQYCSCSQYHQWNLTITELVIATMSARCRILFAYFIFLPIFVTEKDCKICVQRVALHLWPHLWPRVMCFCQLDNEYTVVSVHFCLNFILINDNCTNLHYVILINSVLGV